MWNAVTVAEPTEDLLAGHDEDNWKIYVFNQLHPDDCMTATDAEAENEVGTCASFKVFLRTRDRSGRKWWYQTVIRVDAEDDDEMLMKSLQQVQSSHTLKHTHLTMTCLPFSRLRKRSYSLVFALVYSKR